MGNKYMSNIMPFELYKNLYFVGSTKVSVHIIKTEEGLVMIDTGYPDMYDQILDSMNYLNLDPKDICAIFHSHGHIDHFGCTCRLKELSGAKTYISRIDNDIINGKYDLSWTKELKIEPQPPFDCDVLIEDGDIFTFGSTTIRCVLSPGHTDGTLAYFIELDGDNGRIVAAMHGGVGQNTMSSEFLNKYGLSFDCRLNFKKGLQKLKSEHVDLVLGNHPQQSDTEGKLKRLLDGEKSILDPEEWVAFLDRNDVKMDALMERDPAPQK